jgi:EF-hand domain pair
MAKRNLVTAATIAQLLTAAGCQATHVDKVATAPSAERLEYVSQFKNIDKANKGQISLDQATAYYTTLFTELDKNRDGFLDVRELEPVVPVMGAKTAEDLVVKLDRNSDNKLSRPEFVVIANWLFQLTRSGNDLTLQEVQRNLPVSSQVPRQPTLFGN